MDRFEEIGSRQVQTQLIAVHHGRQIQCLSIHRKQMRTEADGVFAVDEQFLPVFQLTHSIFTDRFQTTLDIVNFDAVVQLFQLFDDVADLFDHQVRREVAIDIVDGVETLYPCLNALQHSFGRVHQRVRSLVSRFHQREFSVFEGVVDFFAFLCQLQDEFIELGKAAFEFFQLDHHLCEELFALFRIVTNVQVVDDGLIQQLHLRIEFGDPFDRCQFTQLLFQNRASLIDGRENSGNAVDDRGALSCVVDLQVTDDFDQHFQLGRTFGDIFFQRLRVGDFRQVLDAGLFVADLLFVRFQRSRSQQKTHTTAGQPFGVLGNVLLQFDNQIRIDVTQIPQGNDVAANSSQVAQRTDKIVDVFETPMPDLGKDLLGAILCRAGFCGGVLFNPDNLVKLVHCGRRSGFDFAQSLGQVEGVFTVQPKVRIGNLTTLLHQIAVEIRVCVFLVDQVQYFMAFRHAANNVLIADFVEKRIVLCVRNVVFADIRCLPYLNGVTFLRVTL